MSAGKEIRNKIKSVENTRKITKAMQMVATSKMRKTQERMKAARPYANTVRQVMLNLANINPYARNYTKFLRNPTEIKRVGIILVTTDKGLCGGLNSGVLKAFLLKVKELKEKNIQVVTCALGQKGFSAVHKLKIEVLTSAVNLGDTPRLEKLIGPISGVLNGFHDGELDEVHVIYSHFVNTMKQVATCERLLPIIPEDNANADLMNNSKPWDYIYEPSAVEVLDGLVRRYVESVVYQCVSDNMASEQASRMLAMKAATDNAGTAISQLKLAYNKSRQATITKELSEIVAGSAAI